jgi:hypothetical protein
MATTRDRRNGYLLTIGAIVVLALGIAVVVWVIEPRVFPECLPDDIACDPTGHPETDEKIPQRMAVLGIATLSAMALFVAGRRLRER